MQWPTQVLAAMNIVSRTHAPHSPVVLDRDHGQSADRGVGLPAPIASATSRNRTSTPNECSDNVRISACVCPSANLPPSNSERPQHAHSSSAVERSSATADYDCTHTCSTSSLQPAATAAAAAARSQHAPTRSTYLTFHWTHPCLSRQALERLKLALDVATASDPHAARTCSEHARVCTSIRCFASYHRQLRAAVAAAVCCGARDRRTASQLRRQLWVPRSPCELPTGVVDPTQRLACTFNPHTVEPFITVSSSSSSSSSSAWS